MLFTSLPFIIFAILLFFLYYLVPKKGQWIVLLIGSLVFYFWAGWKYFIFLVGTIIVFYLLGLWIGKVNESEESKIAKLKEEISDNEAFKQERNKTRKTIGKYKNLICFIGVLLGLGVLFFFKYFNFFGSTFVFWFMKDKTYVGLDLIVPIGLSFYLFSSIGYLIDVGRGVHPSEKNIFKFALFVSFFPVVMQGPICSYSELSTELYSPHDLDQSNVSNGFRRLLLGFFKKVVIADLIGIVVSEVMSNYTDYHGFIFFIIIVFYAIQLYADFSGYMDIAIGYALMLGIKLPENFDTPYLSHSIAEFWRRWHITLGTWFRNYMYFPILRSGWINKIKKGTSKKNKKVGETLVTIIALILVWVSIGLWHGASFNFLIYGCFHGFFVICDAALSGVYKKTRNLLHIKEESKGYRCFQVIRTFIIVCIGFYFFRAATLPQIGYMFKETVRVWDWHQIVDDSLINLGVHWSLFIVVPISILIVIFLNPLFRNITPTSIMKYDLRKKTPIAVQWIFIVIISWAVIAVYIYERSLGSVANSFIYFEF